jgi:acetyl esterase
MKWFCDHYLGDSDPRDPLVSPIFAPPQELVGLPEALIVTAEFDVVRDEGEVYARRLEAAGVQVALRRYEGQIHGFVGLAAILDRGRLAMDDAAAVLGEALRRDLTSNPVDLGQSRGGPWRPMTPWTHACGRGRP